MDNKNQKLFIAQFIATICVVVIHCGTITNHPIVHFFLKSMVCRIAVPFFFVNNAYFFRINSKREGYSKMWLRRIVRLYTIVFLLYIPFGVQLLQDTVDIQWNLWSILLALVVSFLYTGSFYHLWYFPALISSLAIVKYMFQRFDINKEYVSREPTEKNKKQTRKTHLYQIQWSYQLWKNTLIFFLLQEMGYSLVHSLFP